MAEKDDQIIKAEPLADIPSDPPMEPLAETVELPKEKTEAQPVETVISEPEPMVEPLSSPRPEVKPEEPVLAAAPEPMAPVTREKKSSGGFLAALLGGAIALGAGFGLSHFDLLNLRQAPDLSSYDAKITALEAQLKASNGQIAALAQAAPVEIPDQSEAVAALAERLAGLEAQLSALPKGENEEMSRELAALSAKVAEMSAIQPSGLSDQQIRSIIETEIDNRAEAARQKTLAEAEAQAEALKAAALREGALASLREAKVNGQPFAAALQTLGAEAPKAAKFAESGLISLAQLQESFADPAREALALSLRQNAGEGLGDRLWSFLRIQSGARSLSPQTGNDPDAILSRAEAALAQGDLPKAIAEIKSLPAEGQAPMEDWLAQAQARLDALADLDQITEVKE